MTGIDFCIKCRVLALALCAALAPMARPAAAAAPIPEDPVHIQPCVIAERVTCDDRAIEFEQHFAPRESSEQRFFFAAPPNRNITGQVLDARIAIQNKHGAITYLPFSGLTGNREQLRARISGSFAHTLELGQLRHYRIVEIKIVPLLIDQPDDIVWLDSIHVRLNFDRPLDPADASQAAALSAPNLQSHRDFAFVLEKFISNPAGLKLYGNSNPLANSMKELDGTAQPNITATARPLLKMTVEQNGVYKVDQALLAANGLDPAAIRPDQLSIYHHGRQIPIDLIGGLGSAFNPRDTLLFYGTQSDSQYSRASVYYLAQGGAAKPLRMQTAEFPRTAEHVQRPDWYLETRTLDDSTTLIKHTDNFLSIKDFCWVYDELRLDQKLTLKFDLPELADQSGLEEVECSAQLFLLPYTDRLSRVDPPAKIKFSLNGAEHEADFIENKSRRISWKIPVSYLKPAGNTFEAVRVDRTEKRKAGKDEINDGDIFLDSFAVNYPRRLEAIAGELQLSNRDLPASSTTEYRIGGAQPVLPVVLDITDPAQPRQIAFTADGNQPLRFTVAESGPAHYLITDGQRLRTPAQTAPVRLDQRILQPGQPVDYLIISHRDFLEPAQRLAAFEATRGLRSLVVDVDAVYDYFSYGELNPAAIKASLAYALRNWPGGGPLYIVLFGDATSDYRGGFLTDVRNFVPSYTLDRGPFQDRWGSDHWFTTLAGADEYSDVILGRISVANISDAYTVVNKTIQYLSDPAPGPWRQNIMLVADDGRFDEDCEDLRKLFIPAEYRVSRIYLDDQPLKDNFYLPRDMVERERMKVSPVMTTRIMNAFNDGCLLAQYHGHGSPNIWTDERVWFGGGTDNSDNLLLRNRAQPPLLINMTCNSGAIDYPQPPWNICITEDFMRVRNGGVIGCYVPTGPGIPSSHQKISRLLLNNLFGRKIDQVGLAILLSQYQYLAYRFPPDIPQMFLFLGDPALVLPRPDHVEEAHLQGTGCLQGTTTTLNFEHRFASLGNGNARIELFDPQDCLHWSSPQLAVKRGRISQPVIIPAGAEFGDWHIRAYAWNAKNEDVVAWATVSVDRPWLQLAALHTAGTGKVYLPGDNAELEITIKNPSAIDVTGGLLDVFLERDKNSAGNFTVNCSAHAESTVKFTLKIPADFAPISGLCGIRAELRNYCEPPGSTIEPVVRQFLYLPLGASAANQIVRFRADLQPPSALQAKGNGNYAVEWPVYFVSTGPQKPPALSFAITGSQNTEIVQRVECGERFAGQWVTFKGTVKADDPTSSLKLVCRNSDFVYGPAERALPLKPEYLPQLSIAGERIQVTPEAAIESETIFFQVPVINRGACIARDVRIALFDTDPNQNPAAQPLEPKFDYEAKSVLTLYPGTEQLAELRWDPSNNAGDRQLWVKLDSKNEFAEADEQDNITTIPLHVRTKHRLKTGPLHIEKTEDKFQIKINVALSNQGESDAHNVLIEYYRTGEQIPANKMGETLVPRIPASGTLSVPYFHTIDQQDLQSMQEHSGQLIVTYRAGLKGSLQRISSVGVSRNQR